MKKIISYLLIGIFTFSFWNCVSATTYQTNTLIPVDSLATVETESFTYQNFIYYSSVNASKKSTLNFESIKNKSEQKLPVSINLLLFDENKKNIGYLTYCTDKDYDTNWAKYELAKGASVPFSISVSKKYFAREADIYRVKYVAVQDENPYCKVGGYSKYDGLTIEQITSGGVSTEKKPKWSINEISTIFENTGLVTMIIAGIAAFVVCLVLGSVLNSLYKRMYAKATALAYLPVTNCYVSVKLAFGNIVALVYIVFLLISLGLCFAGFSILAIIAGIVGLVAFVIDIVKMITKKYDLFYFEPSINNNYNNNLNQGALTVNNNTYNNNSNNDTISNEMSTPIGGGEVVDLSYSDVDSDSLDGSDVLIGNSSGDLPNAFAPSNLNDISAGSGPLNNNQVNPLFGDTNENNNNNNSNEPNTTTENNSQDESDLSKFFR